MSTIFNQTTQSFNSNNTTLKDVMMSGDLCLGGNLSVAGSISPGTFTNRVETFVDLGAAGAVAASPLTAAQSGTTFLIPLLSGASPQTVSLPPASPGLTYTFFQVGAAAGESFHILCDTAVAENIIGNVDNNATNTPIDHIGLNFLSASVIGNSVTLQAVGSGAGNVWAITQCPGSSATAWAGV